MSQPNREQERHVELQEQLQTQRLQRQQECTPSPLLHKIQEEYRNTTDSIFIPLSSTTGPICKR